LLHSETDVAPECSVVFGGGRLQSDGKTDSRRIEIAFELCYFTRTGPKPDTGGVESLGYDLIPKYDASINDYLTQRATQWRATGLCPDSGFYVATESPWLQSLDEWFRNRCRHYVIVGRDGYIELIAQRFKWREWGWARGRREDAPEHGPIIGEGEGRE
jgi:hypothetical protein